MLLIERCPVTQKFTVGLKLEGKANHVVVEAEDALVAALKAKIVHPEAMITYSRRSNQRGDKRNPPEERIAHP
ncbi:MAG: hypothetical protein K5845_01160 [Filomicrobium sp.]|nr:hypothetical protein [Filomicrobium sp.]